MFFTIISIVLIILVAIGLLFSVAILSDYRSIRHREYLKGPNTSYLRCNVKVTNQSLGLADQFLNRPKTPYILRGIMIFIVVVILLCILFIFDKLEFYVNVCIFVTILPVLLIFIFTYIYYLFSNKFFFKKYYGAKECFRPLPMFTYNNSSFRKAKYIRVSQALRIDNSSFKSYMYGIEIFKKSYPYFDFMELSLYEDADFTGIFTITRNVKLDSFEILSDFEEPSLYNNIYFSNDMYRCNTKEKVHEIKLLHDLELYLIKAYETYNLLFDIRVKNNILYIRSNNNLLINNNHRHSSEKVNDLAPNIDYYNVQHELISIILSNVTEN